MDQLSSFTGKRILVVEDDYFAATELAGKLTAMGAEVAGPSPSLDGALELLDSSTDLAAALLDVRLGDDLVFPLAD